MSTQKKSRVLLAKVGLDGHDRGVKVVAHWLRDAGLEVIFLGRHLTPEQVVKSAIAEDVDVIGLSFLGADHEILLRKTLKEMKKHNLQVPLIAGGVIPKVDIPVLREMGVAEVFGAGTGMEEIVEAVKRLCGVGCYASLQWKSDNQPEEK
jgi:methylmalonyl-CoA mutase C-terminal domain/subunit